MSAKKQGIVDTATRLFAAHGYHAVGIDRIIKESAVAKMTLFRHFPSKHDLICEVLSQRAGATRQSMADAAGAHGTAVERLRAVFDWHHGWFTSPDFTGCLFVGAWSEFHGNNGDNGEPARLALAQKAGLRRFMQDLLGELVAPAEAGPLARQLVMLLDGAILAATAGEREQAAGDAWQAAECLIAARSRKPAHKAVAFEQG
ncbi:TetR/AcrR family transcriptional regulator [Burkholderia sp. 22PA0099]|uniref:TetR/AcrR family transcriptional regulator n=1 Tax=Burkholderia sp. 22PA0099 TaxID=3237372 RepID=UPI0039C05962